MRTVSGGEKLSAAEGIKRASHNLRGTLAEELNEPSPAFSDSNAQLLKFHGSYQQYNRDTATRLKKLGLEKEHHFMVRLKLPGGRLTGGQYLALDALARRYGDGTLRITTRQGFQFYGVVKAELKAFIAEVNALAITTFGACGDVVRNIVTSPAPVADATHRRLAEDARRLSARLLPRTRAYCELWLDGEPLPLGEEEKEPLYGEAYLPRKFKIGITIPEDNSIDVLTNDLAILALFEGERLAGYNIAVGGGLGMTHNKPETYPRLATAIAFVEPDDLIEAAEAVIGLQRDHGDRANRKHARLKYLVAERGAPWVRAELERRFGKPLALPRAMPPLRVADHLGWHDQKDGRFWLGVPVSSGRIADGENGRLLSALKEAVARFAADPVLTPDQNILLSNLPAAARAPLEALFAAHGVPLADEIAPVERWALACPALPTCGLALTEAERVKERLIAAIHAQLEAAGLGREPVAVRITGCPNGCARPYSAEIGIVGRMPGHYALFVGGDFHGAELGFPLLDKVALDDVAPALAPLFELFAVEHRGGEGFGAFCRRQDPDYLRDLAGGLIARNKKEVG